MKASHFQSARFFVMACFCAMTAMNAHAITYGDSTPTFGGAEPADAAPAPAHSSAPETQVSFSPPAGWTVAASTKSRFKVATGPPSRGFVPNISISEAEYAGSAEQFVAENVKNMQGQDAIFHILNQSSFKTRAGLKGVKLIFEINKEKHTFRSTQYIFAPGPGVPLLLVNCSTAAEDGGLYNSLFDQTISTLSVK
jgi:hypothetical protein